MNMKRFLLSILCCLLAVVSGYAEEVTKSVTFSDYTAGTQYAENEKHDLGEGLVIYTTECHFTSELRIYSSSTHNGFVVSDALPGAITKMTFNAGYKQDKLRVYGSNDGTSWDKIGDIETSTAYSDYSLDFSNNYTYFKLDVVGTNQIRLQSMSVTYTTSGAPEPPKETVATPVINPSTTTFNTGESVYVSITTETEGATIHYTTNGDTPTAGSSVYYEPFEVNTTTTVKAIAVMDDWNDSEVAEVKYTMVDPNAVEKTGTISFASTTQRVSQDGNSQVWKNDNITFTNNKSGSQNAVVSNVNPVRLYANSEIIIEAPGNISKIVFDCNSANYATVLKNSIGNSAEVSSDKVTVTLDGTSSSFTVQKLSAQVRLDALTVTYIDGGETDTPTLSAPTMSPGTCNFYEESLVVTLANVDSEATIYYTLNGNTPNEESNIYEGPITINETTTIKAIAIKEGANNSDISEATYTKIEAGEGESLDILTRELTGVNAVASYENWSGVSVNSTAVYAGNSAGGNNSIQLRTTNSNSGIVTTVSGGRVKRIIVEWNSQTSADRILNVYGKHTPYATAEDLYDNDTDGTLLGSIEYGTSNGTSTTLDINGDYEYIGLRSSSGAMYLNSIAIIWEPPYTLNVTDARWATLYLDKSVKIPEDVTCYVISAVTAESATLTKVTGVLPANTGAIVNADAGEYEFAVTEGSVTVESLLLGTTKNEYINEEAYVLGMVDGVVGLYKAEMNDGKFLNNANKAYLLASEVPTAQGTKALKFRFDDQTTGINGVTTGKKPEVIFDLYGRKVNNATAPGLYIINGKKVMVK